MNRFSIRWAIFSALLVATTATAGEPPEASSAPRSDDSSEHAVAPPSVVLLRNGEVLEGVVETDEGAIVLHLAQGHIRIRAADVLAVCPDVQAAYEAQRTRLRPGEVAGRVQLASWCARHGLNECARHEVEQALAIDPRHPLALQMARGFDLSVVPRSLSALAAQTEPENGMASLVRGLPAEAVAEFVSNVQPLLLNRCTTSGCHSPTSDTKLRLTRLSVHRQRTRRVTERNLAAVLALVDRDDPRESRILAAVSAPHGVKRRVVLSPDEWGRLASWVDTVSRGDAVSRGAAVAEANEVDPPAVLDALHGRNDRQTRAASGSRANRRAPGIVAGARHEATALEEAAIEEAPDPADFNAEGEAAKADRVDNSNGETMPELH